MRVLDLFSGLGGFSQAFKDRGHWVITVDNNPKFKPDLEKDINLLKSDELPGPFHVILASPPCQCFSVANIGRRWKGGIPDKKTVDAINLVNKTLKLIEQLKPKFWVLENPRGMLRTIIGKPQTTISQCQYGNIYMKPTDLWGKLPSTFIPKMCKNNSSCHEKAPRGSLTGLQKIRNPELRALIPYKLSLELCLACENDL